MKKGFLRGRVKFYLRLRLFALACKLLKLRVFQAFFGINLFTGTILKFFDYNFNPILLKSFGKKIISKYPNKLTKGKKIQIFLIPID